MNTGLVDSIAKLSEYSIQRALNCVKGFVLLSAAEGYGSRAEICCSQLDWQHYHFYRWASLVGLFNQTPELAVTNLNLVAQNLEYLGEVLSNLNRLQHDYDLELEATNEEVEETVASKALFSGLYALPNAAAKDFVSNTTDIFRRRTVEWRKLRWITFDQAKFEVLIADIQHFNEKLRTTLHFKEQEEYAGVSDHTLRSLITQISSQPLLEVITKKLEVLDDAVSAAARLKQQSLLLGVLDDSSRSMPTQPRAENTFRNVSISGKANVTLGNVYHTHNHFCGGRMSTAFSDCTTASDATDDSNSRASTPFPPPTPPLTQRKAIHSKNLKIEYHELHRSQTLDTANHELAVYRGIQVVVEWKDVPRSFERRLKYRVAAVAELLSSITDPTFHSLHCVGYIKQPKTSRYGYVFEVPSRNSFSLLTLHDILLKSSLKPSLNQRLTLAIALVETILQLHTAGWLHKSIRSDNVLFFQDHSVDNHSSSLPQAYLGGYEFARLDQVLETTESPNPDDHARLYRHPLSLSEDRIPFCKAFDLYSLGCVLLEIGLWRLMPAMLLLWITASKKSEFRLSGHPKGLMPIGASQWQKVFAEKEIFLSSIGNSAVGDELRYSMGEKYTKLVEKCFTAAPLSLQTVAEDDDSEFDDPEFSLTIQYELHQELRNMLNGL